MAWTHGAVTGYMNHGCRCDRCRLAWREYRATRGLVSLCDERYFGDLLHELFPDGLTTAAERALHDNREEAMAA